ncbi:MAG TPA: outer membrane protein transport protein [Oligoflexus sp.]|uniref:OmpP1/FadL family transporter n=1 Tax=Oligoflexus sp. TaxID=1971216 RepID=UPI002D52430B|nr:outer membrane protein transport protein [Oligoflexus sp.]HYX38008.1 outer membrane protein transport protein [Oligoflexus sp.]
MQFSVGQRSYTGWVVPGLLLALCGQKAFGAGFAIRGQSASSIGTAGASDVAGTTDISAMFSNPAALGAFKGTNVSVGGAYVRPNAKFKEGNRTVPTIGVDATAANMGATESDDFSDNAFLPSVYASYQVNDALTAGASITVPFGTNTDYGKDWVGRYHGTKTELEVVNFDLAASYAVMDNLKIGVGVQVQSARGLIEGASNLGAQEYSTAARSAAGLVANYFTAAGAYAQSGNDPAFFPAVAAAQTQINGSQLAQQFQAAVQGAIAGQPPASVPGIVANTLTRAGAAYTVANEGRDDVYAEYEGNDVALGFTAGILYSATPEVDLGLSYRSQVVHKTEGDYTLSGDTSAAQARVNAIGADHKAKLNLPVPDIIGLGAVYKGIPGTNIYASATLTRWSKLEDFNVDPDDLPNVVVRLNWEDVWHVGLGADYRLNEYFILRAGLGNDNSPTTNEMRSPRSPDDNRRLYSLGMRYAAETWSFDAGVMHAHFRTPTLDLKEDAYPEAQGRGNLTGKYEVSAQTLMIQYNRVI